MLRVFTAVSAEKRASKSHQELFEICPLEQAHLLSQQDTAALVEGSDTKVRRWLASASTTYLLLYPRFAQPSVPTYSSVKKRSMNGATLVHLRVIQRGAAVVPSEHHQHEPLRC